ncbi:CocE/NonD family hydrolase [Anatilimnocola aggregata]|nr:CocE/NonD family hydrolase [Anatilimnocola aggregata]
MRSSMKANLAILMTLVLCSSVQAEVKTETLNVVMRDGVKLATDVYRDDAVKQAPVVLIRTPYDRTKQKGIAERWVKAGYVFVAQDCRGTRASEGVLAPYNNEGQDGYDSIEWLTRQPWCNGRVGMVGGSYVGAVQWQAAVENPPGLAVIAPQATWSSFYKNLYLGGAVRLSLISNWIAGNTPKPEGLKPRDMNDALMRLPLSDVDEAIGWPMPWLDAYLTHPEPNGFWTRLDLTSRLPELQLPALHVVGYYDFFSRESVDNFVIMQTQARDPTTRQNQRLVLGPWDHGTIGKSQVAEVDFGPEAALDISAIQFDWFDRHLKQDPAAQAKSFPPVRYFSMGDNVWRDAQQWPPEGVTPTSFFLHSDGKANTRKGTGRISREAPTKEQPADTFRADPAIPVPACPVTATRPIKAAVWGPVDQSALEDRDDMLVYSTTPLTEPLTFAGNLEAKLFVSTDTPDADWVVKIVDVRPDGAAINLATGILRGRYRKSLLKPELMKPGEVYEIRVDLGPCAATIAQGHQLRVDVCGSLFPLFDRNPNTAEGIFSDKTAMATEQLHHRPAALSRIILPISSTK